MSSAVEAVCIKKEEERRHIPAEVVEEILLKLPVRSLFSFSRVSKTWSSMIFDLGFVKRHRSVDRIIMTGLSSSSVFLCAPSSENPMENATEIVCPFGGKPFRVVATCDDLWCVQVDYSMYLWDPPLSIYRKVPYPVGRSLCLGLGYDCNGDDYKLLSISEKRRGLLYSLRSNCWREIDECFPGFLDPNDKCVYLDGSLHWIGFRSNSAVVVSFNLSTEKYLEMTEPRIEVRQRGHNVDLSVLKGKLCVGMNCNGKFMWWLKKEDSWMKIIDIEYVSCLSDHYRMMEFHLHLDSDEVNRLFKSRPFYFCDNGDVLIQIHSLYYKEIRGLFVYNQEKGTMKKVLQGDFTAYYKYVENLYFSRIILPHY